LPLSLPEGSELFMDSGYTDYAAEDAARELDGVTFAVQRRRGQKRWDELRLVYYKQLMRKRIETAITCRQRCRWYQQHQRPGSALPGR